MTFEMRVTDRLLGVFSATRLRDGLIGRIGLARADAMIQREWQDNSIGYLADYNGELKELVSRFGSDEQVCRFVKDLLDTDGVLNPSSAEHIARTLAENVAEQIRNRKGERSCQMDVLEKFEKSLAGCWGNLADKWLEGSPRKKEILCSVWRETTSDALRKVADKKWAETPMPRHGLIIRV